MKKNLELVFNNNGNLTYTIIKFYLYQFIYQEFNFHLIRKSMILEKERVNLNGEKKIGYE